MANQTPIDRWSFTSKVLIMLHATNQTGFHGPIVELIEGKTFDAVGVSPGIPVPVFAAPDIAARRDPALATAINELTAALSRVGAGALAHHLTRSPSPVRSKKVVPTYGSKVKPDHNQERDDSVSLKVNTIDRGDDQQTTSIQKEALIQCSASSNYSPESPDINPTARYRTSA